MFDKRLRVCGLPGPLPQLIFQEGERAELLEPSLQDDNSDCR
jgi:hypothetical protein